MASAVSPEEAERKAQVFLAAFDELFPKIGNKQRSLGVVRQLTAGTFRLLLIELGEVAPAAMREAVECRRRDLGRKIHKVLKSIEDSQEAV